ncbi:hypothetical protein RND71_023080 [Anisodus tanguticus]|uniref:Uncharacterized protein n=1 Tax=Anisodus tanguticus TaxID=243964 RepID=A0AAE1RSF6_9SOLA|nr:hypothetical protein RND71_023080 [Anisodus tanguticus]
MPFFYNRFLFLFRLKRIMFHPFPHVSNNCSILSSFYLCWYDFDVLACMVSEWTGNRNHQNLNLLKFITYKAKGKHKFTVSCKYTDIHCL